ncbi:hypothetical protein CANCADRAFT_3147 [Tortispora caseinolytica NRRL Y-17796]|uniref:Uncharacterized protein n=1 Tax=Tortispora caseinolytica NRRL Y-17796 TaxID=767744 RepID=A0A1E4T9S1_9ASCO|nr:hypothetical protein CANCADRAFT_3147 [Tortispora caseinolytica NRRL Y-17796]
MNMHDDTHSGNGYSDKDAQELRAINTAHTLPPEVFERLYYQPKPNNDSSLRHKLGVPTGLAILLYTLNFFYISFFLMGWRGAGGGGAAMVGTFISVGFVGIIVAIFELILGNSFIFTVLTAYAVFYLSYASTIIPWFGAKAAYSSTGNAIEGGSSESYLVTCALFFVLWGVVSLILTAGAAMVNFLLTGFLFLVFLTFCLLSAGFFHAASGNAAALHDFSVAAGAVAFAAGCFGLYLSVMNVMISVGVPPTYFPVGDFTSFWAKRIRPKDIENTM